jgi:imidazolonepropionase-like amidohydrolase
MSGPVPSLPTRGDAVLTNLRLVDGIDPRPQDGMAIVIRDGVIAAIVADTDAGADAIDLRGAFVMPGLINMHTHFSLSLPGAGGDAVSTLDDHELAFYMADGARRTLLSGVTTVRSTRVTRRVRASSPRDEPCAAPAGTATTPTTRSSATARTPSRRASAARSRRAPI